MTPDPGEDSSVKVRIGGRELSMAPTEEQKLRVKALTNTVLHEPFTARPWKELAFFLLGSGLAGVGLAFVAFTMGAGVVLAITVVGLAILALSLRSARGIGALQRSLARNMLGEEVEDPEPFLGRPGFFGWLGSRLRDRVAWRSVAYLALKVPWSILGVFVAFSLWWDAFVLLTLPLFGHGGGGSPVWGLVSAFFPAHDFNGFNSGGFTRDLAGFVLGAIFFFAAPWVMRGFVNVDRQMIRSLLGADPDGRRLGRHAAPH